MKKEFDEAKRLGSSDPMKPTKSEMALNYINESIKSGLTIYVATMTRCTAISPRTFAKWEKSGHKLFKILNDGSLAMASGKTYGRIATADMMLATIRAQ
jgi:hypothetical protein